MSSRFDQATNFTGLSIKFATPKTGNAAARRAALGDAAEGKLRIGADGGNLYIKFGDANVEVTTSSFDIYLPTGAYETIRCHQGDTHIAVLTEAASDWTAIFCEVV